jgi:plastocyanin
MKNTLNRTIIITLLFLTSAFIPDNAFAAVPACRLTADAGDVIVSFGGVILMSNRAPQTHTVTANVPAGTYNLIAETWDYHSGKGDQNQHHERVKFTGFNSSNATVFTSTPTDDIPANQDWQVTNLNTNLVLNSNVTKITVSHNHIGTSNWQSLAPVCLKFKNVTPPPPADPELGASCTPSILNPKIGQTVTWTANPTGGNGTYTYNWSGTDNLSGNTKQINKSYSTVGTKNASVVITSGSQTKTVNCSNAIVYEEVVDSNPSASCSVSRTRVDVGQSVTFSSNVSGGKSPYTYRWSGDTTGSSSSRTTTFNREGTYRVYLEVTDDNGRRSTDTCATVVVEDDDDYYDDYDLDVECRVSNTRVREGEYVTFEAIVRDGKSPYRYTWSGDVRGSDRRERVRFNEEGRYTAEVTVRDDAGNRETERCDVVRVDRDDDYDDDYYNVITTSTPINPGTGNLASVNSVYLSQLPYTGPEDIAKVIGYISLLLLISSIIGYSLLNNRKRKEVSNRIKAFKEANKLNKIA